MQDVSEDEEEESSTKTEEVAQDVEEEEKGYGGIKMDSVTDIIAKARFNESYLSANLGLSENLEELASHFQSEQSNVQLLCLMVNSFCSFVNM